MPGPFMVLPDVEANYMMRFFIVRSDVDGKVTSVATDYVASVDEAEALQYAEEALSRKAERGYINEYRYGKKTAGGTTVTVFMNASRELQYMKTLQILTLAVSGASLLLVFLLVVLLSGKMILPIADNIERQKQFITDASHELKTPLTSISTSLDVLELENGEDEWTGNIRKQTGRMAKLVSELVTLSRLDEENPLPHKESFSLSNAAWEIVEVYRTQAKGRGKEFSADIEEDVSLVGDKAAIQQMLSVLLDNAVRYSDEGGEIRFSVQKKKNRVQIEVFNTCDYETPPDIRRLFDRFYRPDGSRSTETGGTGVGLAIAKAVAETHGGRISASCPSGKTMTMTVIL
ncbi:MAG: HAMP domain-containing histidine kinase [Lachnospiraceae bacterium]|nr:HAMP domain-containing histidine kinase [Lachnospiraceae bacterium]